jgi:peptide/nickel transport system permease protein
MIKYTIRRCIQAVPVLILITILLFFMMRVQGNPADRFAQNPRVTAAQIAAFEHRWGLDKPLPIQYCDWIGVCGDKPFLLNALPAAIGGGDNGVLHADFGYSTFDGRLVTDIIAQRALPTIILMTTAYIIWITVAIFAGVYAAVKRYSLFDSGLTIFNYIGYSLPTFWLGLMLITFFAVPPLRWFPASGMNDAYTTPGFGTDAYWAFFGANPLFAIFDLGRHLVLPVITLVLVSIAGDSRFVRSSMLDSLNQDYVKTARAKGVPERRVILRHALRNALLPVITNIGLELPILFSGAIVTETIFAWPGMGRQLIESLGHADYPVLMGVLLITSVFVVFANLLADIMYAVVDPRVKYD